MKTSEGFIIRVISAIEIILLNLTVLGIYAKNTDPYVLFLVKVAIFFDRSKIPSSVLCTIPQGTFIPSLVPIDQVVSEEKSFEKLLTTTMDAK